LIPTIVIQFAPGGPVEQVIAQLTGQGGDAPPTGSPAVAVADQEDGCRAQRRFGDLKYRGAQGLDPEFIAKLEAQFGFDKPPLERFGLMMWNYMRSISARAISATSVIDLIIEKSCRFRSRSGCGSR
jgi:microcin C transport system permease protein